MSAEEKPKVVDLRGALAEGKTVFVIADDQAIGPSNVHGVGAPGGGPATDKRAPWERWERKVQEYKGTVPVSDGKRATRFPINELCDVVNKDGEKCGLDLIVDKTLNFGPKWDEFHISAQLDYDKKDIRYYKWCPLHGPFPPGPPRWDKNGKAVWSR